ncbi:MULTISPECIES: sensor histidine kinase [unclassified Paenibacillus]|uniref:cache domain-containing sensor histidine kinase n=1 Tax=unclassified Paenibacillus TaxID=185978 RepID=UPI0003F8C409|nr:MULTISPECIES: sensor histidine kinase [unclassified Paenibacillus]KKC47675.1 histidine kinase [Paenibacillus sp. D9]CDN44119.1 ATPase/histidine kinase/DNA gyrase B/HSP90 domain protein [Paenibacillus sp. P22]
MENWLGKSLKHKLSLLTILAVLVPLMSLGLLSYSIAEGLSEEKAKIDGMKTLDLLQAYLDNMVADVENMSLFLIGNENVQKDLQAGQRDARKQTAIISFLTDLAFSKPYISNITIDGSGGSSPVSIRSVVSSGLDRLAAEDPEHYGPHAKWWSSVYVQTTSLDSQQVLTMSRPIRSTTRYDKVIGQLRISLDQSVIAGQLRQSELEGSGSVVLLDGQGRIMAGPPRWETNRPLTDYLPGLTGLDGESGVLTYGQNDTRSTVLYRSLGRADWKLAGIIPFQEYRSQNRYFLTLTAISVCIALLFVIVVVGFIVRKVTGPLSSLTRQLRGANPEEPLPVIPVTTIDEVGQLVISYNRLSSRIVNLTEEVKRSESMKKEADMLALQAQINPHFLYNTLSSVQWMALMNKDARTAEMVGSLSDFLRFSLNKGQEYCTVSQEISHVQSYIKVQSIRYPERFWFRTEVPQELLERRMLKLLLQPLIENALLHGILKRPEPGGIEVIAAPVEEGIRFTVRDDGVGIEPAKLEELRGLLVSRLLPGFDTATGGEYGSYGLRNVHNRLLLHYGPGAGLQVESRVGEGTVVMFVLPEPAEEEGSG